MALEINVKDMVASMGGPEMLSTLLKKEGLANIDAPAIKAWQIRNKIPGDRLIQLMVLARRLKMPFNPLAYVVE